jgi:exonuclease III
MDALALPSPLPTRQLFSAGAPSVEPRTNPTRAAATQQQRDSTEHDNDCTIIKLATYNIRDGRNSNLEAALRACEQMRIDVGVLTETRLSTDRYTRSAYGYTVFATQTAHTNQGGIALIFTNSLYFQVEAQQKHGPNIISCILVTGTKKYPIIGTYIPPHDTTTLYYIAQACERFTGQSIILLGDINIDLRKQTPTNRDTEIMALLATLGLEDMSTHFLQRKKFRHGNTWQMGREGNIIQSRCDYTLGTDRRIFKYISIKDPFYNSDNFMMTGGIHSASKNDNIKYRRRRQKFPLRHTANQSETETEYDKLKRLITIQAPNTDRQAKAPWISETTWKLIDTRTSKNKIRSFLPGERQRLS